MVKDLVLGADWKLITGFCTLKERFFSSNNTVKMSVFVANILVLLSYIPYISSFGIWQGDPI